MDNNIKFFLIKYGLPKNYWQSFIKYYKNSNNPVPNGFKDFYSNLKNRIDYELHNLESELE